MSDSPLLGLSQRLPPSNAQVEQALLGALMANNLAFRHVQGFLKPQHFSDPVNGAIFDAIEGHVARGKLADPISLRAEFEHTGALDEVGGTAYLAQLMTAMVGIINAGEYGRCIRDAWVRRQLVDIGEEIVNRAFGTDPEMDGAQQVANAQTRLAALLNSPGAARRWHAVELAHVVATPAIIGLGQPDEYGEMPRHAVALTDNEIQSLHGEHAHAAKVWRPRKRQKQSERDAHLHSWHVARTALFEGLMPTEEMDPEDVDQAADEVRHPAGMQAGGEVVDGRHVVMEPPDGYLPVRRAAGEIKTEAELSIAADEASLNDLVQNTSGTVTGILTPDAAGWLLQKARRVAHDNDTVVRLLIDRLQDGKWVHTGDAILVASSGLVVDGLRRLAAIHQSGVAVLASVIFGYQGLGPLGTLERSGQVTGPMRRALGDEGQQS